MLIQGVVFEKQHESLVRMMSSKKKKKKMIHGVTQSVKLPESPLCDSPDGVNPEQIHPKFQGPSLIFPQKSQSRLYIGDVSPLLIRRLFPAAELLS